MLGAVIRTLGRMVYKHPTVPQDVEGKGPFGKLKVALLADAFTSTCLAPECRIRSLTPANYQDVLCNWQPDLLFVESAFHGVGGEWRYMLARQPAWLRMGKPHTVARLVRMARDWGIPSVFWNKDDGAFFEPFLDVACLFEYVFTTDNTCVPRYQATLPSGSMVDVLAMPVQPTFHHFSGFDFQENAACFVGSYYRKILNTRRIFLDMIFNACKASDMPLHIFDRNSNRLSHFMEFRFPQEAGLHVHDKVAYTETARVYKHYAVSLNVNSVTDSSTMCSRRLLEILACGGICVTNPSPAVEKHFAPYCHILRTEEQARELLARLKYGPSDEDKERARAGADYVRQHHTWQHRLQQLAESVDF